jgi:hypothetical protein
MRNEIEYVSFVFPEGSVVKPTLAALAGICLGLCGSNSGLAAHAAEPGEVDGLAREIRQPHRRHRLAGLRAGRRHRPVSIAIRGGRGGGELGNQSL